MTAGVDRLAVGVAAAVSDPGATRGTHDGVQGNGKSARRLNALNVISVAAVDVRLAVRNGDHAEGPETHSAAIRAGRS